MGAIIGGASTLSPAGAGLGALIGVLVFFLLICTSGLFGFGNGDFFQYIMSINCVLEVLRGIGFLLWVMCKVATGGD